MKNTVADFVGSSIFFLAGSRFLAQSLSSWMFLTVDKQFLSGRTMLEEFAGNILCQDVAQFEVPLAGGGGRFAWLVCRGKFYVCKT